MPSGDAKPIRAHIPGVGSDRIKGHRESLLHHCELAMTFIKGLEAVPFVAHDTAYQYTNTPDPSI